LSCTCETMHLHPDRRRVAACACVEDGDEAHDLAIVLADQTLHLGVKLLLTQPTARLGGLEFEDFCTRWSSRARGRDHKTPMTW